VISVLDSDAERPGFKLQPRHCPITVLGKLFTPIVPLVTKQRNCHIPCGKIIDNEKAIKITPMVRDARVTAGLAESNGSLLPGL